MKLDILFIGGNVKNTGMVRKVDRLGRIVIPKEIRNTLRITIDDPLELFIDGENIILKKFSYMKNFKEVASSLLNSLSIKNDNVILYDSETIYIAIGKYKNELIGKRPLDILKYLNSYSDVEKSEIINLVENISMYINYYIKPILSNGIIVGVIMYFSESALDSKNISIINYIGNYLGNYIYT